jgi:hypothetical protein
MKGRGLRRMLSLLLTLALLLGTRGALADKVAVLKFNGSPPTSVEDARHQVEQAVTRMGHSTPSSSELLSANMAVADGTADTTQEFRAAGRASGSDWSVAGQLEARATGYRLELLVCLIESGRVESVARDIDPLQASAQVQEMLAFVLRKEGIGNDMPPWTMGGAKPAAPALPPATPAPKAPDVPKAPPVPYGDQHPLALGLGAGAQAALLRPDTTRGSSFTIPVHVAAGYAFAQVPGFELRALATVNTVGPQAFTLDVGGRYALNVARTVYIGPELGLGTLVTLGAAKTGRFLLRGSPFVAFAITENVQLEASPDLLLSPGGSGTLLLFGGSLRGLYRF